MNYPSIGTCAKCGSYPHLHRTQIDRTQGRKVRVAWVQDDTQAGIRIRHVTPSSVIKSSAEALPSLAFPHESAWGKYPNCPPPDHIWTDMAFDYVNVCPKCNPTPERQSTIHQANNQWNAEQDRPKQPDHQSTEPVNPPANKPERVYDAFVRSANRVYDRLNTGEWSEYQLSAASVQRFRDSIQGLKPSTFLDIVDVAMSDLLPAPKPVDLPAVKAPEVAAAQDPNKQPTKPYHEPAFPLVPSKEMWEMGCGVQTGMTLHDWYAGQALAGYGGTEFGSVEMGARFFFDLADAMMTERARRAKAT